MTGPSRLASSVAWPTGMAPAAIRMTAAGAAATASGQPRGLVTAQASTASRAISDTVSPATAFSASPSPPGRMSCQLVLDSPSNQRGCARAR
jgi:hypothetical protein